MKKILIWDINFVLKPQGGPSGYLYNIKNEVEKLSKNRNIYFLRDLITQNEQIPFSKEKKIGHIKSFLIHQKWIIFIYNLCMVYKVYSKPVHNINIDLNQYDVIHFHQVDDIVNAKLLLESYNGKIFLTTHSPESFASEYLYYLFGNKCFVMRKHLKKYLLKKEIEAYSMADKVLFPTKYSIEPYLKETVIRDLFNKIESKFVFCPTCIIDIHNEEYEKSYWNIKYGIPMDAFVVLYIGRHNEVKGYDYLLNIGLKMLSTYPNVYFVIAGRDGEIKALDHPRWIELGWVNNSSELLHQADVFVLPNRETYFDIVALEVLRAGTPLIATRTGGNKYLEELSNLDKSKLQFVEYGNVDECVNIVDELISQKKIDNLSEMRLLSRSMFDKHFKISNYILNYQKVIDSVF